MYRCYLHSVALFSYWFDNLGFITEGNTYRRCAASSLPLWGNTNVASSRIKRNFWHRCREGSSTYTRFLNTNLISSQFILFSFAIYFICLLFSDLLNKKYKNTLLQFILFGVRSINIYYPLTSVCQFIAPLPKRD